MRGDVDNQPQIAVRAAILPRRPLAFQADTLTITAIQKPIPESLTP